MKVDSEAELLRATIFTKCAFFVYHLKVQKFIFLFWQKIQYILYLLYTICTLVGLGGGADLPPLGVFRRNFFKATFHLQNQS